MNGLVNDWLDIARKAATGLEAVSFTLLGGHHSPWRMSRVREHACQDGTPIRRESFRTLLHTCQRLQLYFACDEHRETAFNTETKQLTALGFRCCSAGRRRKPAPENGATGADGI